MPIVRYKLLSITLFISHSLAGTNNTQHVLAIYRLPPRTQLIETSARNLSDNRSKRPNQLARWIKTKISKALSPAKTPTLTPPSIFERLKNLITDTTSLFTMQQLRRTCVATRESHKNRLAQNDIWINGIIPPRSFFEKTSEIPFSPYLQKKVLDNDINPRRNIIGISDLHGDIQSFVTLLEHFQERNFLRLHPDGSITIIDPHVLFIFTGDYVDRGKYGVETLKLVLDFYSNNPEQVVLIRGNHEDFIINSTNGFHQELLKKFDLNPRQRAEHVRYLQDIYSCYEYLPVAFYVGSKNKAGSPPTTKFVKFCHGGFDLGSDPRPLLNADDSKSMALITSLDRLSCLHKLCCNTKSLSSFIRKPEDLAQQFPLHIKDITTLTSPASCQLGDIWGDIVFDQGQEHIMKKGIRGPASVEYGKNFVHALCQAASSANVQLIATVRGHQHTFHTMPLIALHGGAHRAWHSCQPCNEKRPPSSTAHHVIPLQLGDVITVAPAPLSGYGQLFGYNYIPYVELNIAETTLTTHQVPVILPKKS